MILRRWEGEVVCTLTYHFFSPLGWRSTANSFVGEDKSKYAKDNSQGMLSHPCKEVGSKGDVYFFQFERRKVDSDDEDF